MALDAHKLAPLLQSLEALALAGSEVDDAAREQVWDSLSPAARQMAQALFAGRPRESAAAVVTPPRTFCGVERFPEDVLGAIIAFVDLPMRFTCVAACSTLRDACARQSPRLEHSLVAKHFPLITTFGSAGAPAPRDLFRTFKDFEGGNAFAVRPETSVALVAYTLSLEIKARKMESKGPGEGWRYTGTEDTIYVGTGRFRSRADGDEDITYIFTVPEAALESAVQLPESDVERWSFFATVVASRRGASGKLQYAKLYHLHCNLRQIEHLGFDVMEIPPVAANQALNYIKWRADDSDMYTDPVLELLYNAVSGSVEATFKWNTPNDIVDMTLHEARACLEHYAAWSE